MGGREGGSGPEDGRRATQKHGGGGAEPRQAFTFRRVLKLSSTGPSQGQTGHSMVDGPLALQCLLTCSSASRHGPSGTNARSNRQDPEPPDTSSPAS